MIVSLTTTKAQKLKKACQKLLSQSHPTIRAVSEVIGILVASFPGVEMGPLYYRHLENDKIAALKANFGQYDAVMTVSSTSRLDLQWWVDNVEITSKPIIKSKPEHNLYVQMLL